MATTPTPTHTRRAFLGTVLGSLASLANAPDKDGQLRAEGLKEGLETPLRPPRDTPGTKEYAERLEQASRISAADLALAYCNDGNPDRKPGYIDTKIPATDNGNLGCAAALSYLLLVLRLPVQGDKSQKMKVFFSTNELGDVLDSLVKAGYLRKLEPGESVMRGDVVNARTDQQKRRKKNGDIKAGHCGICVAQPKDKPLIMATNSSSNNTSAIDVVTGQVRELSGVKGEFITNYSYRNFKESYDAVVVYRFCRIPKVEQNILANIAEKYKNLAPQKD